MWDESTFDSMDFALLSSLAHPDAPGPELDLLTAWYVWAFYFDDHFLAAYKRGRDLPGARTHLARMAAIMSLDPLEAAPEPTGPVERGLADLWPRTMLGMSPAWRQRFVRSTQELLRESMWEMRNISRDRVPNPIEYIDNRGRVGGASWCTRLVEHAVSVEIAPDLAARRAMRVLNDTFADAVHLLNDIFSYQRETQREGELANCVLVVERFLGCDPVEAVEIVNDLRTSRLRQFDNTVAAEVPAMFEEHRLDAVNRAQVIAYIKGLQDWQAGGHEWHLRSSRYAHHGDAAPAPFPFDVISTPLGLSGLGAAATVVRGLGRGATPQLDRPTAVFGIEPPLLYMPFPARTNPHLAVTRRHVRQWAGKMGMLDTRPDAAGPPVWDAQSFEAFDFGFFAAATHPGASVADLDLIGAWYVWGWYIDDYLVERYKRRRDLAGARLFLARLPAFMPRRPGEAVPAPDNPVERGLAELWTRSGSRTSASWRDRMAANMPNCHEGALWEIGNVVRQGIPDAIDHAEMRREVGGAPWAAMLVEYDTGVDLPAAVATSSVMRELIAAFSDAIGYHNDVFSHDRETGFEKVPDNGVLVMRQLLGCDGRPAVQIVASLADSRTRHFEEIVAQDLPTLFDELDLDSAERTSVGQFVHGLEDWLAGDYAWHQATRRYSDIECSIPPAARWLAAHAGGSLAWTLSGDAPVIEV